MASVSEESFAGACEVVENLKFLEGALGHLRSCLVVYFEALSDCNGEDESSAHCGTQNMHVSLVVEELPLFLRAFLV